MRFFFALMLICCCAGFPIPEKDDKESFMEKAIQKWDKMVGDPVKAFPKEMTLKLIGDPLLKQSSRMGLYVIQESLVNNHPYWLNNNGISAMWFFPKRQIWMIGDLAQLGTSAGGMMSVAPAPRSPVDVTTWYYTSAEAGWQQSYDILLLKGKNSEGKYPLDLLKMMVKNFMDQNDEKVWPFNSWNMELFQTCSFSWIFFYIIHILISCYNVANYNPDH